MFSNKPRLYGLLKELVSVCFVSGHDFIRADKDFFPILSRLQPAALKPPAAKAVVSGAVAARLKSCPDTNPLLPAFRKWVERLAVTFDSQRIAPTAAGAAAMLCATGCSRAPSFNILGSFFPAWLLCGLLGIVLTVIVRLIFVRIGFEKELSPLILVYPCLAAFFTFSIWLVFFS